MIEKCARKHGFKVVPAFTGHGIGEYFHGAPDIYHFSIIIFPTSIWLMYFISNIYTGNNYPGIMETGNTFTIEPAISQGSEQCVILEDGWTAVTLDGSRAAQFEHTVLITTSGVEVLTR